MVAEGGEGENPLPFSQPQNVGGGGGGGGEGGVSRLRFPPVPPKHEVCVEAPGFWWAGPQALGARAPSPLETWPTHWLTSCFNFLLRLKPMGPGLKTLLLP